MTKQTRQPRLRSLPGGGRPGRAAARYGSALVVLPHRMTATVVQTITAAHAFGHLDITWTPRAQVRAEPLAHPGDHQRAPRRTAGPAPSSAT